MDRSIHFVVPLAAAVAFCAYEGRAQAITCDSLPNVLYLQIGDTQEPVIKALGQAIRNSSAKTFSIAYITSGSCTNIADIFTDVPMTTNLLYVPSSTEMPSWDPSQPSPQCTLSSSHAIDVANSNVFVTSCTSDATPPGLSLFQAAIQGYVFVVPEASSQIAITAEEAYFTFGFGMNGQAQPWTNESLMFIRPVTKSTLVALAANIDVPAADWKGVQLSTSTQVETAVATSANPEPTIGILGVEIYDPARNQLNALAYRAFQQTYAYFPDKTANSFDKQNIRDGHYTPWSPTVYITATDGGGNIVDDRADYLIKMLQSLPTATTPDFNPLDIVISKGLVPDCAMKVTRQYDGGPISFYTPSEPCGCYFESRVGQTSASCVACSGSSPCATGTCRLGYCEKQ